jgi:DNA modification methylase
MKLLQGDCLEVMAGMDAGSVDAIVTDPPYGLSFMGKEWDHGVPGIPFWTEMLRILKPGGHLLSFGGSRTYHRMACAVEDAGFEIRDQIMWIYGSGFPKSKNVALGIDKGEGHPNRGKAIPTASKFQNGTTQHLKSNPVGPYEPRSEEAMDWEGWGTALKPAHEPIVVARKPLIGTVAKNVLEHGTGGINVDGCRVSDKGGRWPANVIHDGSNEVLGLLPDSVGNKGIHGTMKGGRHGGQFAGGGKSGDREYNFVGYGDSGSAARFFYCAKANKKERGEGNSHPTVKPLALMRYLCRLVTPPGGTLLDPFMGSGTTVLAALEEGFDPVGIELEPEYLEIAKSRVAPGKSLWA